MGILDKNKDNLLVDYFLSYVLGDFGVDKTPKKIDNKKIKVFFENIVYERIVSECKKLGHLIHNLVRRNPTVLS